MSPTAASCPSCQIVYSELYSQTEERLWDKAVDKIIDELDEIANANAADLVCQKCHSILKSPRATCNSCGFSPPRAETEPERSAEERTPQPEITELEAENEGAVCPLCDSVVGLDDTTCPHCGAEFLPYEAIAEDENAEPVYCPACYKEVGLDADKCPYCGAEFDEGEAIAEDENAEPIYCPACYKEVGLDADKCPYCGAEFDEGEELGYPLPVGDTHPDRAAEPLISPESLASEDRARSVEISTSSPARRPVGHRGLSNGTSAVNGVGIINGKSRINGVNLTNGLGATNGREMINGTGFSRGSFADNIRIPLGRKGIAVLMAVAIVISASIYVSLSREGSPYEVDGDFSEWGDIAKFTMITASASPEANVIEWAAATYDSQLHVYARVEGLLMASTSAQRLVFFVDADDQDNTGYLVGSIGADFMLDILGFNESVVASPVYTFTSARDQLDWSLWRQTGSAISGLSGHGIEAMAQLSAQLDDNSRVILVSQNQDGIQCMSYPVVLRGGLLAVEQNPVPEVVETGIIPSSRQEEFIQLRFTCQGERGSVESIEPELIGVNLGESITPFSLEPNQMHTIDIVVDSFDTLRGQFVSATVESSGVSSSFSRVLVTGEGARAYCISPPDGILIDGAFADWVNITVADSDELPVANPNVNIEDVGAQSSDDNSYFYISVFGEICSGVYIPKECGVFTGTGGGTPVATRKTAEDFARIFIDSDRSSITGKAVTIGTLTVGADYMVEVGGACGEIRSKIAYAYLSGAWNELDIPIQVAKDSSRMEIGVITSSIGNPDSMDFVIETSDWRCCGDLATNVTYGTKRWVVDSSATSDIATSMSYQRKIFYDGTNYWSFYFDGSDTVCKYSSDDGETWTSRGAVFSASGVREVSIWYDEDNKVVYAVGDVSSPSSDVYLQKGAVNPASHTITWAASYSTLSVSIVDLGGKNAYICRDENGYLWVVGTNMSQSSPDKYKFTAFRSNSTNDITEWVYSGEMLPSAGVNVVEIRGSIVPAGSGSDVWAIFMYDGYVYSKKYTGTWPGTGTEIFAPKDGNRDNTLYAAPSVVADGDGVVHVVYGDDTASGAVLLSHIWYTYNNTDSTSWATAVDLNESMSSSVGNRYPTISLETSTGDLYAFWIRTTNSGVGQTVMGKKKSSGSWSDLAISNPDVYTKNHLTSIYSVSGESHVCWQWTQNTTEEDIEVIFDSIPEFGDAVVPMLFVLAIFFVAMRRRRKRQNCLEGIGDGYHAES
ncbi:MAG: zinc ribbon domain-containing protein [Thermoplasmata archaeon]|nr:zinc ribbon domain-containing protein [Thermoplasmata archaeon]